MHAISHDGGTIRAASLVRVSMKGQADKGLSLDEQARRVARYISDQEWTPAGEYREPGVSGKRKDRPELDRLLADAEARLFDRVVGRSETAAQNMRNQPRLLRKVGVCPGGWGRFWGAAELLDL